MKIIVCLIIASLIIAFRVYYFYLQNKNEKVFIGDVAVDCLRNEELIAIATNADKPEKDRELASDELARRKIKI